jgi:hypothetical protein
MYLDDRISYVLRAFNQRKKAMINNITEFTNND